MRRLLFLVIAVGCSGPAEVDGGPGDAGRDAGSDAGAMDDAGSDAGSDAGPVPPGDTCADAIDANTAGAVDETGALVVTGSNVRARSDLDVCVEFGGFDAINDVVYRYTAPTSGGLHFVLDDLTPTRFNVNVRTSCEDATSEIHCEDCGVSCRGDFELAAGETIFFIVSAFRTTGNTGGMGDFELTLMFDPDPVVGGRCVIGGRPCPTGNVCQELEGELPICGVLACGDGYLGEDPLMCEDGNTTAGDGCDASCMLDMQPAGGETCDAPTVLNLPRTRDLLSTGALRYATATGDFAGSSDLTASCAAANGPEAVYTFELTAPGHVELNASNTEVLSLRRAGTTDCGTEELGCTMGPTTPSLSLDQDLPAGRYAVILDRLDPSATGTYELVVLVRPTP